MTKQELIKMTGSEEQAAYAMEILLKNCKKAFVEMTIRAELNEIEREVKAFVQEGILVKCNSSYHVNWGEEQKAESEAIENRCRDASALLYRRNRTISLIAVRV